MKSVVQRLALVALTGAIACGGTDAPGDQVDDTPDAGGDVSDTTAPRVLSTSPETGATGLANDVAVSITFSEAMDQASVEGTLDTSDLGPVTMSWNAAGDTLTMTPNQPLAYAQGIGDDPSSVTAERYVVTMGSAALDLAGNPLGAGIQISFDTLKEMSLTVDLDDQLSRTMTPSELRFQGDDPLVIGDDAADQGLRSTITMDLSPVPASALAISSATLATRQQVGDLSGAPFDDLGDSVLLDHVVFAGLASEQQINAAFNTSQVALAAHSQFCVTGQVVIEYDVTADVDDDLQNRGLRLDRSQFLLYFATATDLDGAVDRAVISRDLLELQVKYLAP
jgi:hypothetical protein